jgi:hypothetical protein
MKVRKLPAVGRAFIPAAIADGSAGDVHGTAKVGAASQESGFRNRERGCAENRASCGWVPRCAGAFQVLEACIADLVAVEDAAPGACVRAKQEDGEKADHFERDKSRLDRNGRDVMKGKGHKEREKGI